MDVHCTSSTRSRCLSRFKTRVHDGDELRSAGIYMHLVFVVPVVLHELRVAADLVEVCDLRELNGIVKRFWRRGIELKAQLTRAFQINRLQILQLHHILLFQLCRNRCPQERKLREERQ